MQESYKNEALHLIEKFKNAFKCTSRGPYWYLSEDGSIVFGTVYFINNENYFSKFPISAWEKIGLIPIIIVLIFSIRLEKSLFMICMQNSTYADQDSPCPRIFDKWNLFCVKKTE